MWVQLDDNRLNDQDAALLAYVRERIVHYRELEQHEDTAKYRAAAHDRAKEGELEFDDDGVVSMGDDPGAYVMGWYWIGKERAGIPEDDQDEEGDDDQESCTCSDRSWYGAYHDSVCPLAGLPKDPGPAGTPKSPILRKAGL